MCKNKTLCLKRYKAASRYGPTLAHSACLAQIDKSERAAI